MRRAENWCCRLGGTARSTYPLGDSCAVIREEVLLPKPCAGRTAGGVLAKETFIMAELRDMNNDGGAGAAPSPKRCSAAEAASAVPNASRRSVSSSGGTCSNDTGAGRMLASGASSSSSSLHASSPTSCSASAELPPAVLPPRPPPPRSICIAEGGLRSGASSSRSKTTVCRLVSAERLAADASAAYAASLRLHGCWPSPRTSDTPPSFGTGALRGSLAAPTSPESKPRTCASRLGGSGGCGNAVFAAVSFSTYAAVASTAGG
mmetsp:Transcript_25227/g.74531  ORF Transcript_25227/g.74531 Transcript_25227/m.74531 type:complete len:263 (+) Transcript_25227:2231-3019(+)|eukprot:364825-Chlamydomonas_euryale.AAC.13